MHPHEVVTIKRALASVRHPVTGRPNIAELARRAKIAYPTLHQYVRPNKPRKISIRVYAKLLAYVRCLKHKRRQRCVTSRR